MTKRKVANHGDLIIYPVAKVSLPAKAVKAKLHILQDSGVTGNRHEVVCKAASIYRFEKNGKEYISCAKPFIIQHVGGDQEHGVQNLEAGTWEVRHEDEHDPWKNELRRVID